MTERITYARATHGEEEIDAVLGVLRSGHQGLRIGKNVFELERRVPELSGKRFGVMCNSGSSGLYLAVELLGLAPGTEVITSPLTFSTDVAPIVRAGLVPVFVDVEPGTFNIDVAKIEAMVTEKTGALLIPNLAGNCPDWDAIREVADRHGLKVVEDTCDTLGATLRGTPTGARADLSVTSFSMAHIITCAGTGGMVMMDDEDARDRALLLRRWGRRSEPNLFGNGSGRVFREDLDGVDYDNDFIFDLLPWNFEPSELGAAYGVVQLDKLERNFERRKKTFAAYTAAYAAHPEFFTTPVETEGLDTAWLCYPVMVAAEAPFSRSDLQEFLESRGIDTRTVWSGNITRHPMMAGIEFGAPEEGLPEADAVFERGMTLGMSHGLTDDEVARIGAAIDDFAAKWK
ncbi:DegT/DnrJ/EryC1/StrS family aminotransferase [Rhodococcus triatomae]|uniref:CDP-6-deoxy-D-xylo-4-hexulose-3-dehydrase n=1 Tax=Rhodococcus triatomae TaxID=300028 RepID=A0A1G8QGN8_9NOCA|nr:DegT/DnrJ/EryC1/StrS family aminotransferase [Rhodococcus triatomae]QNG20673.1 DegT/DnrJ/EryC1/StrS family aminotransferase [Rhodococcus triatomae]QNG23409.1 DegT/DnrJ/EryC1/StrS family aminotransferase [Rhodococcus triatomae]SDJ03954.1 CDP-6-deoxy-D-xylo-4-hexulose-3-dehydrase [Rhodococcus triatomae]